MKIFDNECEIKNVKFSCGHKSITKPNDLPEEKHGFKAALCWDGHKIATVSVDGTGDDDGYSISCESKNEFKAQQQPLSIIDRWLKENYAIMHEIYGNGVIIDRQCLLFLLYREFAQKKMYPAIKRKMDKCLMFGDLNNYKSMSSKDGLLLSETWTKNEAFFKEALEMGSNNGRLLNDNIPEKYLNGIEVYKWNFKP